jgi:metal-dependent amidase/aminoacylase/carboxypeptidase family protein
MDTSSLKQLSKFRKTLHQYPELSGLEVETAKMVLEFFKGLKPDQTFTALGGTGLAFVFKGMEEGPTSLFRCELDGLPIMEENSIHHISTIPGKSHVCGHDGHMAIITGLGVELSNIAQKEER